MGPGPQLASEALDRGKSRSGWSARSIRGSHDMQRIERNHAARASASAERLALAASCLVVAASCSAPSGGAATHPASARDVQPTPAAASLAVGGVDVATAVPQETPAAAESAAPAEDPALPIHGSWISRYRLRSGAGASDQDIYETLILDVGDSRTNDFTAHFMGSVSADIDGRRDRDSQYVFPSAADSFSEPVQTWLYEAYVDVARPPLVSEMRVGRQFDYLTPEFAHFDGVRLATQPIGSKKWTAGVYGGVPVRLYDATSVQDTIFGLWGESQPWSNGRVRLDWMHVEDDDRFGANANDLLGLTVWQRLDEHARIDARYTRLEEEDRDVRLRANWDDAKSDFRVQASYYRLLETQRNFAVEFDPLFSTLQSFYPYSQYRVQASKGITSKTRLDGGVDLRDVADAADEGAFNRNFDREWLSLVLLDTWLPGLTLTLTGDVWNGDGRDVDTWGLDATREFDGGYRWSLGSSYSLYKYDYFLDTERDNVRVWYLRVRKQLGKSGSVDVRYDYEDLDDDTFHSLLVGATWRF